MLMNEYCITYVYTTTVPERGNTSRTPMIGPTGAVLRRRAVSCTDTVI